MSHNPIEIKLPNNQSVITDKGLVIVGANGSGKTRLGTWLYAQHASSAHRISAQKRLGFSSEVSSTQKASEDFSRSHKANAFNPTNMQRDYDQLLAWLFSEENAACRDYRLQSISEKNKVNPVPTKLERIKSIWEEVLPHRKLIIGNQFIKAKSKHADAEEYSASEMSDGERVIFYLIGHCLIAKPQGIIIIDEPEMHLHKAIQSTLWNKIERERADCIFVYLTHDVAFAASRAGFTKLWLESYDSKNNWQLTQLEESQELPEELLLELYGSRRKILLIEGISGSNESQFYQNLFEDFLIKPCGSCENVISYVKALKNNTEFHHEKVYGLIDRDRRTDEEVEALKENNIFTLEVAEFENLFATPEILKIVADRQAHDAEKKAEEVKAFVFDEFNKELDAQIQLHVQQEIKWRLNGLDLSKLKDSNSLADLINTNLDTDDIKKELTAAFEKIRDNSDYTFLLKKYNRKTIASRIGAIFGLKTDELPNFVVRLSNQNDFQKNLRNAVLFYLPPKFNDLLTDKSSEQATNPVEDVNEVEPA